MISIKPNEKFRITGVVSAIQKNARPDFSFLGESHPFWELLYVRSGELEVVEREENYILREGELICHAPDEFHRIKGTDGATTVFSVISFTHDGELPPRIGGGVFKLDRVMLEKYNELTEQILFFYHEKAENKPRYRDECESDPYTFTISGNPDKVGQAGLANLTAFLISLSLEEPRKQAEERGAAKEYAELVRSMYSNADRPLRLGDLSKLHHISPSYITKLFTLYAGEGPMTYFGRIRIARVKELLRSGESVSGICELMSFSSPSYLSSFFKRWCGMSPAEWIKAEKNKV